MPRRRHDSLSFHHHTHRPGSKKKDNATTAAEEQEGGAAAGGATASGSVYDRLFEESRKRLERIKARMATKTVKEGYTFRPALSVSVE